MNVDQGACREPDETWWQATEIRDALAARDIAAVFAFLRTRGVSQRRIAAHTGLAASEVYEVTKGRRIMAYDVLCRIADGLSIPRGYMGLAYDAATTRLLRNQAGNDRAEISRLLSHAALLTLGLDAAADTDPTAGWDVTHSELTPLPARLGQPDIEQVEAITAGLRALDHQYGGGACRAAVLAQAAWASSLLGQQMSDDVRRRLHVTLPTCTTSRDGRRSMSASAPMPGITSPWHSSTAAKAVNRR